jgi:hypothetical protein
MFFEMCSASSKGPKRTAGGYPGFEKQILFLALFGSPGAASQFVMRYNVVFSPLLYGIFQRLRVMKDCLLSSSICAQFRDDWVGDARLCANNLLYFMLA